MKPRLIPVSILGVVLVLSFAPATQAALAPPFTDHSMESADSGGNVFSRFDYTVAQILEDVLNIINQTNLADVTHRFGGHTNPVFAPEFTEGDTTRLGNDINFMLTNFTPGTEVFTVKIDPGAKCYFDGIGFSACTPDPAQFDPLPFSEELNLTFFAGRNTAAAPSLDTFQQLEIVTQGVKYKIFAFDTTGPEPGSLGIIMVGSLFLIPRRATANRDP